MPPLLLNPNIPTVPGVSARMPLMDAYSTSPQKRRSDTEHENITSGGGRRTFRFPPVLPPLRQTLHGWKPGFPTSNSDKELCLSDTGSPASEYGQLDRDELKSVRNCPDKVPVTFGGLYAARSKSGRACLTQYPTTDRRGPAWDQSIYRDILGQWGKRLDLMTLAGIFQEQDSPLDSRVYLVSPSLKYGTAAPVLDYCPVPDALSPLRMVPEALQRLGAEGILHGNREASDISTNVSERACISDPSSSGPPNMGLRLMHFDRSSPRSSYHSIDHQLRTGLERLFASFSSSEHVDYPPQDITWGEVCSAFSEAATPTWAPIQAAAPLGEYPWMAPELLRSNWEDMCRPISPASDIYSFGCLSYEVLTRHPPLSHIEPGLASRFTHILKEVLRPDRPPSDSAPGAEAYCICRLFEEICQMMELCRRRDPSLRPLHLSPRITDAPNQTVAVSLSSLPSSPLILICKRHANDASLLAYLSLYRSLSEL
ncbi:hypothetical protein FA13DRAFT_639887 [Coprinellus micaceus]|uniref:Protein kinase domain-containing protein n=1 Tax=Coprinellus micaceus TaxID=71717 RepID=A0A4Y7T719_COPMI|nr:hypothetical protein FA13DRAFT_639887 [Coprinellus micaceus]